MTNIGALTVSVSNVRFPPFPATNDPLRTGQKAKISNRMKQWVVLIAIVCALAACESQSSKVAQAARDCGIDPRNLDWSIDELKPNVTDTNGGPIFAFEVTPEDSSLAAKTAAYRSADCLSRWGAEHVGWVVDRGYPKRP